MTATVPAASQTVNGSPSTQTPSAIVAMGPAMPHCAAMGAPMRPMAIITITTGKKVHTVPLIADNQSTSGATTKPVSGLINKKCPMHNTLATDEAKQAKRAAPSLRTTSPVWVR